MEVYLYCSYEHSQKGFFMTRLEGGSLVPLQSPPENVESFFSYDRFQVLWYDICSPEEQTVWKPQPSAGFFGIRNLRGEMSDGRRATANLAFIAQEEELSWLRRIGLWVLGDYPAFQRQMTRWLSVGGHSYVLDVEAFQKWMDCCARAGSMQRFAAPSSRAAEMLAWMQRTHAPKIEFELLRLAVYTSNWKDVQKLMGNRRVWLLKHPNAITPEEFAQVFEQSAPLWALNEGEKRE